MDANTVAQRSWAMRVNLMRVALSILHHNADAEDAVSAAMLKACQKASSLSHDEKLNAWMMRILVLTCYDALKQRKRETPVEDTRVVDEPVFVYAENTVWECIEELPAAYRKVLVLFYYEGFKAHEIARILSLPLGTVLGNLSRGRKKLKKIVEMRGVAHGDEQAF